MALASVIEAASKKSAAEESGSYQSSVTPSQA